MITQDAFTRGNNLIETILQKMSGLKKWRRDFIMHTFMLSLSIHGRFNFLQMYRQGKFHEQTYRNNFETKFDFLTFNRELVNRVSSGEVVIAFDPSYISKSGKQTPGVGYFYSGVASRYKRGLEIGGIAAIDVKQNTAYHLEAIQTPSAKKDNVNEDYTLVDHYADLIIQKAPELLNISQILVVDGYFSKYKFVEAIDTHTAFTVVSRLRDDANLRYLNKKTKNKGRGRPKKYDGKIDTTNIDRRKFAKVHHDEEHIVYEAVVHSMSLKRRIKVAYVEFLDDNQNVALCKMFFSTDLQMPAMDIVRYYKSRFQIEYLYRDAKQFTGLQHSQARSKNKLHFHFNTSLTAVSLAKAIQRMDANKDEILRTSIYDVTTELSNRNWIIRIFSMYGFDHNLIKITPDNFEAYHKYRKLLNFGKIAA